MGLPYEMSDLGLVKELPDKLLGEHKGVHKVCFDLCQRESNMGSSSVYKG